MTSPTVKNLNSRYARSLQLLEQSKKTVVPGSSTISKRADLYPLGAFPIYLNRADGAIVEDVDGNHYVDFQSALGAVLLGFNHPHVKAAIEKQLSLGTLFSLSHPSLIQLAEKICKIIPCAERVRILKNGSDATTGAVRIARAYTGREIILTGHYHSWHDWYYISTNLNKGIPSVLKQNIIPFPYGDLNQLKAILKEQQGKVAGIIMEVTHLDPPPAGYLEAVKALAAEQDIVLIFDEVVTGFRFGLGGAQSYFGVTPDIACFAKALGNGCPIALIAGKKEIMDATHDVVTTQTYAEECLSIAAAIATLEVMEQEPVVEHVWKLGQFFKDAYSALGQKYGIDTQCLGYPPRLQLEFGQRGNLSGKYLKSYLLQETAKAGFLIAHMIFMNYAHTEKNVQDLLNSIETVFKDFATKPEKEIILEGDIALELW